MSDITTILKLNKEIDDFVENQKEVIKSFKKDNKIRQCDVKFIKTLFHNIDNLIYKKDSILGLREDKVEDIIEENKQLKEQAEKLEERYRVRSKSYNNILLENAKLYDQLKQRDEVIDETIKFCNYLLENNEVEIDSVRYYKHSCDDIITNAILLKLQRRKK